MPFERHEVSQLLALVLSRDTELWPRSDSIGLVRSKVEVAGHIWGSSKKRQKLRAQIKGLGSGLRARNSGLGLTSFSYKVLRIKEA